MINHQLGPCLGDLPLSYPMVFQSFDVLDILGFLQRKHDSQCNLKFMSWIGFKRVRSKFGWAISLSLEKVTSDTRYIKAMWLEKMIIQIFNRLQTSEHNMVTKQEIEALKHQFLIKDCSGNDKEKQIRKQIFSLTKKYLKLLGIIEKQLQPVQGSEEQQILGYRLMFKYFDELDTQKVKD